MATFEMYIYIDDQVKGLPKIIIRMMIIYYNIYFFYRFKVFADYEDYIKCQEKVNELYKVGRLELFPLQYISCLSQLEETPHLAMAVVMPCITTAMARWGVCVGGEGGSVPTGPTHVYMHCTQTAASRHCGRKRRANIHITNVFIDTFPVFFSPEPQRMDQEGDLQHRWLWKVLQRSHHRPVRPRDLGHGAHA